MDRYLDCLLDNDLNQLIITGTPTPEELTIAWNKVYVEALQLSQSDSYNDVFDLTKKINDRRAKIVIANNIVKHLQIGFDQELVDILNSMALMCNITADDKGAVLINKLNGVVARIKPWFNKLAQLQAELDEIRSNSTNKTDRAYFDGWLDAMSEDKGYHVEAGKITVARFYRAKNKLTQKAITAQLNQKRHGRSAS